MSADVKAVLNNDNIMKHLLKNKQIRYQPEASYLLASGGNPHQLNKSVYKLVEKEHEPGIIILYLVASCSVVFC